MIGDDRRLVVTEALLEGECDRTVPQTASGRAQAVIHGLSDEWVVELEAAHADLAHERRGCRSFEGIEQIDLVRAEDPREHVRLKRAADDRRRAEGLLDPVAEAIDALLDDRLDVRRCRHIRRGHVDVPHTIGIDSDDVDRDEVPHEFGDEHRVAARLLDEVARQLFPVVGQRLPGRALEYGENLGLAERLHLDHGRVR